MDTRIELTIEELKANGWILQRSQEKLDWWIDEAFELKSTWNPVGTIIYFTLDVDPEATSGRRKGEKIISFSLSKTIPETRLSAD